jgi:two-component system response regulator PilR (NtrC family)
MTPMSDARVLIVDDEPDLVELVAMTLDRMGLQHSAASTLDAARKQLLATHHDLVLCDMRLPDGDGLDLLDWLQTRRPGVPCAVITAHGNVETAVRALKLGAFDFVSKPLDLAALRRLITSALKLSERPGGGPLTYTGPRLLGASAPMQQLREMIGRVARSQAPVHISGESGTGKELVARLIHLSGPRSEGPFVAVNCGAIPTLFLDEVADLPLHMQVKLLRVIQEKSVRPVGETIEQPVDVRLLSATHKKLVDLVARGSFREDLFYRINVIELRVPSLRERPEDIPELASHILHRLARRSDEDESAEVSPDALALLGGYSFPGNVRELENILERALTLSLDKTIRPADIKLRTVPRRETPEPQAVRAAPIGAEVDPGSEALGERLDELERDAIVRALEQTRYNKTAAAKLLGVTFRALRYRIKKLGIE